MTALRDVLFGTPLDPRPIAGVLFGAAPAVLAVQPGAVPVVGGVILPVPGPRGEPGPVASETLQLVAGLPMPQGQPVYVSRASGQFQPANASTYLGSFVVGLLSEAVAAGFIGTAKRGPVTLPDWTALTGAVALLPGQVYFLTPQGGLSPTAPSRPSAAALAGVGEAITPTTLDVRPSAPIQL